MYVQSIPGLIPGYFIPPSRETDLPFPLNAQHQKYSFVARSLIYHVFKNIPIKTDEVVLMPDYHSGTEVWAVRAAGITVKFYPVHWNLEPDFEELTRLCRTTNARVLYTIHYLGWPQPIEALLKLCKEHDMILFEDCALSLLSKVKDRPLGTFGSYAAFCLYKTLPVPNGGLLVQNDNVITDIERLQMQSCSKVSVIGQSAELFFQRFRGRSETVGSALYGIKKGAGRFLSSVGVKRLPVGDISPNFSTVGYDTDKMNIGMSPLCHHILNNMDYADIIRRRRANFVRLKDMLNGEVFVLRDDLDPGVCPMFFPLLVPDKPKARRALFERGVDTVEFWNYGHPDARPHTGKDSTFLRKHLLEVPIHQDITQKQLQYMANIILELKNMVRQRF